MKYKDHVTVTDQPSAAENDTATWAAKSLVDTIVEEDDHPPGHVSLLSIPTPIPYIPPGGLASAPLPATQRPAPSLWPSSGVGRAFSQRRALS